MQYAHLFSPQRTGGGPSEGDQGMARHTYQRDFDRLIFSSAFRRMQNKTQVFPLPEASVFVHNRLTHSLEVASVGRSLGNLVGQHIARKLKEGTAEADFYQNQLGAVIAAACLAHDMGNPPFGHSGERAIGTFFERNPTHLAHIDPRLHGDFTAFEGNANGFRLMTARFRGRRAGGLCLTHATLAATLKYPCASHARQPKGDRPKHLSRKKYGFFETDRQAFEQVVETTRLPWHPGLEGEACLRHPFVFLTEAADDICYRIIDLEDGHRLGIVPHGQLVDMLRRLNRALGGQQTLDSIDRALKYLADEAGDTDRNEIIAYYRAKSINTLVEACVMAYQVNEEAILAGTLEQSLLDVLPAEGLAVLSEIDTFSLRELYRHRSVIEIELAGHKILGGLLDTFVPALLKPSGAYEQKVLALLPFQYRPADNATPYQQVQAAVDFVSGMTDNFALALYRKLMGIDW